MESLTDSSVRDLTALIGSLRETFTDPEITLQEQFKRTYAHLERLEAGYTQLDERDKNEFIVTIEKLVTNSNMYLDIYIHSFLLQITGYQKYMDILLDYAECTLTSLSIVDFLFWQLTRIMFLKPQLKTVDNQIKVRKLYRSIYFEVKQVIKEEYRWIPSTERNQQLVVVITNQFIELPHGPTQTVLDRCYILQKYFGKTVLLINTASLPRTAVIPFYKPLLGNYKESFTNQAALNYEQLDFAFYQYSNTMLDIDEISAVVQSICDLKPQFVFSLGGSNITADLCSKLVPVATLPFSYDLPITEGTFHVIARPLQDEDQPFLKAFNISAESVIESEFTFKVRSQSRKMTRKEIGVPDNAFVIAVVGTRLDSEIQGEFEIELNQFLERNRNIYIVFAGSFSNYKIKSNTLKQFKTQTVSLGYQEDISAVLELCDSYLNPPRLGGGTSAAEALYKGMPIFTFPFGDVSYTAGVSYHIDQLNDIERFVELWKDEDFRKKQKEFALARANEIFDGKKVMANMLNEIMKSSLFC